MIAYHKPNALLAFQGITFNMVHVLHVLLLVQSVLLKILAHNVSLHFFL